MTPLRMVEEIQSQTGMEVSSTVDLKDIIREACQLEKKRTPKGQRNVMLSLKLHTVNISTTDTDTDKCMKHLQL